MKYVELDEEMEMPCLCDCGKWFDLLDGHGTKGSNKVVCSDCHQQELDNTTTIGKLKRGESFNDGQGDEYRVTSKYQVKRGSLIAVDEFGTTRQFYYDDNEVVLIPKD